MTIDATVKLAKPVDRIVAETVGQGRYVNRQKKVWAVAYRFSASGASMISKRTRRVLFSLKFDMMASKRIAATLTMIFV